jgi:hypothetical protein
VKPLYANDKCVSSSVSLRSVTLERLNIFEIRFRHPTNRVIGRFKFVFLTKSDGPYTVMDQNLKVI